MIRIIRYIRSFFKTAPARSGLFLGGNNRYDVRVAGTSMRQPFLKWRAGGRREHSASVLCYADLYYEDSNPFDSNAIRVEIEGQHVGYLPRSMCQSFRENLIALGINGQVVFCRAKIVGGWTDESGSGDFGVRLNIAWPLKLRKAPDRN